MEWEKCKVFFPGPTWVAPEVLAAMSAPPLHHRSAEYRALHHEVVAGLRRALYTEGSVYLLSSSSTGAMEAAVRNGVRRRVLCLANGAFGERFHSIAAACGKDAQLLAVPWGQGLRPEAVREALADPSFDAVTLVHNETSVGVINPLEAIAAVVQEERPDVMLLVDAVSSLMGAKIEVDRLGLDVCLAGVQKCFALPPGLAVVAVSGRLLERARELDDRGYYFDFLGLEAAARKDETPATPSTAHVAALRLQLERIFKEGLETRFERHAAMAARTQAWAEERFGLFAEAGYRSPSVSCIGNKRGLDLAAFLARLRERGYIAASGYGKLKGSTFRIGHMGDLGLADVEELLGAADEVLGGMA